MAGAARLFSGWRTAIVVAGAAVLMAAGLVTGIGQEAVYRARKTDEARVQANILAATVPVALVFGDRAKLSEFVQALRANPEVDAVGVFDLRGVLQASFTRSHITDRLAGTAPPQPTAPLLGGGRVVVTAPVTFQGQPLGEVYLRTRLEPVETRLLRFSPLAFVIAMAGLMLLLMGDHSRRLARANQELIGEMAERARAEQALRQSQKMEAVGRLTGGVAHDFNNMLAIVIGNLDVLLGRFPKADPQLLRLVRAALEGAQRGATLTRRLLAFSRLQPLDPSATDVARSVADMSDLLRRTLGEKIAMETVNGAGLWLAHIDRGELETAIVNLAINARDAMPQGGKLTIETGNAFLDRAYAAANPGVEPGQYVIVAVTDTGCGMTPEVIEQVFEPFYTTKPVGAGTGLGLSQVQGFVTQSGGHVSLYSEPGLGTTVKLYLPRSHAEAAEVEAPPAAAAAPHGKGVTVLVVEDEAGVREFAAEALGSLGYAVLAAAGAREAMTILERSPDIGILLTDVVMPEMNGRLLAGQARARRPGLKVVYMTGYTRNAIVHNGVLDFDAHLVSKPFTVAELGAELDAVLAAAPVPAALN